MAKIYVCDNCGTQLGEEACSNSKEGVYCSAMCSDEAETPQDLICILANLARRVASLEQQLRDTQGNVERLAEELATVKNLADSNEQGIAMLDILTQPKSSARLLSEAFDALSSYERMSRR
jgi:TolA-binding protein